MKSKQLAGGPKRDLLKLVANTWELVTSVAQLGQRILDVDQRRVPVGEGAARSTGGWKKKDLERKKGEASAGGYDAPQTGYKTTIMTLAKTQQSTTRCLVCSSTVGAANFTASDCLALWDPLGIHSRVNGDRAKRTL